MFHNDANKGFRVILGPNDLGLCVRQARWCDLWTCYHPQKRAQLDEIDAWMENRRDHERSYVPQKRDVQT